MVDIVVVRIVTTEHLQRVIWEAITTVVVYGFKSGHRKEKHCFSRRHAYDELGDSSP